MDKRQKEFMLYCALGTLLEVYGEGLTLTDHEEARFIEIAQELEGQMTHKELLALVKEMARESMSRLLASEEGQEC